MARLKEADWKAISNALQRALYSLQTSEKVFGSITWTFEERMQQQLCLAVSSRWASWQYWWPHSDEPVVCPTGLRATVTWPAGGRGGVGFLLSFAGNTLQAVLNMPGC